MRCVYMYTYMCTYIPHYPSTITIVYVSAQPMTRLMVTCVLHPTHAASQYIIHATFIPSRCHSIIHVTDYICHVHARYAISNMPTVLVARHTHQHTPTHNIPQPSFTP